MRFLVTRTSCNREDNKPCENAFKAKYVGINILSFDSFEKIPAYAGNPKAIKAEREKWFSFGFNHRVENGRMKRDFEKEGYFIELDSLNDLIDFCKANDRVIVAVADEYSNEHTIEIYDDYRE